MKQVAAANFDVAFDADAVDERAVGAAGVSDYQPTLIDAKLGVNVGDGGVVNGKRRSRMPSDHKRRFQHTDALHRLVVV